MSLGNILILSVFARHKWFTQKRGCVFSKTKKDASVILRWSYSHYSVASTNQAAFFIGGWDGSSQSSVIAKYENDNWSLYGNLNKPRMAHGSIIFGTATIVIGGSSDGSSS